MLQLKLDDPETPFNSDGKEQYESDFDDEDVTETGSGNGNSLSEVVSENVSDGISETRCGQTYS